MHESKPHVPCSFRREECLVGPDLEEALRLVSTGSMSVTLECRDRTATRHKTLASSRLETVLATHPPIFESLLAHLPTSAIFDLYHTSSALRTFLRQYPLAWRDLSFRMLPPAPTASGTILEQSTSETATQEGSGRACSLAKLLRVILPFGPCLTRLDLDNTCISGTELYAQVLDKRRNTLQHLSVRGCKDVSLKYHILPFLEMELSAPADLLGNTPLALKSLYVYRCRHHRRRPYLPSSLNRRDSDSQPTHQFIELCHRLGIWTDTAWCPVPGPRCHRRKDYYVSRHGTLGDTEIWVPFDRLWRSQNTIGPVDEDLDPSFRQRQQDCGQRRSTGKLWEESDYGFAGEALGSSNTDAGEGKGLPTHQRRSHRTFVEGFTCDTCGDEILERCEQCSIRMHCMGCRKTLCASCAFDRPLPAKRRRTARRESLVTVEDSNVAPAGGIRTNSSAQSLIRSSGHADAKNKFWWAPGAWRSPNKMSESSFDPEFSEDDETSLLDHAPPLHLNDPNNVIPRLDMHWCCLKPSFSGGGGITYIGAQCGDNIKAAPLPRGQGFEDPSFITEIDTDTSLSSSSSRSEDSEDDIDSRVAFGDMWKRIAASPSGNFDIIPYLEQDVDPGSVAEMRWTSPRSLCSQCYSSRTWRVLCGSCKLPLCIDHDIKSLNAIKCGYRNLVRERETVQAAKMCLRNGDAVPPSHRARSTMVFFSKWRPIVDDMRAVDRARAARGLWAPSDKSYDAPDEVPQTGNGLAMLPKDEDDTADCSLVALDQGTSGAMPLLHRRTKSLSHLSTLVRPNSADSVTPDSTSTMALDFGAPRWHGCGRFFCPAPRAAGDPRSRCAPEGWVQMCRACGVHVCQTCLDDAGESVSCSCAACSDRGFTCPNCRVHPDVVRACTWHDEDAARQALEAREAAQWRERWLGERGERAAADELAEGVAEFYGGVEAWA